MSLFKHKKKHSKGDSTSQNNIIVDNSNLFNPDGDIGPTLPEEKWIDKNLLLCVNPSVANYTHTNYDKQIAIPLNSVFDFESKLFKGQAIIRAVDLHNTDKAYFKGRNRKMDFTFQGQFKRKICFDRLYTGQVFDKPFTKLPGHYIIAGAIKLVKTLAPALRADINSATPHMISPLASAAQVFTICKPGDEIPLPREPKENVSLLDKKFTNMKWTDRKAYFHDLSNLSEYYFEPGLIYTISCYSHMISPTSYSIHALGMKWGIHQYVPSPIQIATVILPVTRTPIASNANISDSSTSQNEKIEQLDSEELECESKEEEEEEDIKTVLIHDEHQDLSQCEFLINLQVWHAKLAHELYPQLKH
eukprot:946038_1